MSTLRCAAPICITALLLSLCGCGVPKGAELSDRLIVEAIGVDLADGGCAVTLEALDLHAAGSKNGGEETDRATRVYRFLGPTAGQALKAAESVTGLKPLYSQTRLLVLGRSIAEEGVGDSLDYLMRAFYTRGDILIATALDAGELLGAAAENRTPRAEMLEDAILRGSEAGACCEVRLFEFMQRLYSPGEAAFCPLIGFESAPEEGLLQTKLAGTAVFTDGRWTCTADEDATRGLLLLTNRLRRGALTAEGDLGTYGLQITKARTALEFLHDSGGAVCRLRVTANCDITEHIPRGAAQPENAVEADARDAADRALNGLVNGSVMFFYYLHRADVCRLARHADLACGRREAAAFSESLFSLKAAGIEICTKVSVRSAGRENL